MVYFAFDLLWLDGKDLCQTPLEARKARLARLLAGSAVGFSASLKGDPAEIAANAAKLEIEGIVAKRRDSTYMPGARLMTSITAKRRSAASRSSRRIADFTLSCVRLNRARR